MAVVWREKLCRAGGVTNWAKLGVNTSHPNYGKPCAPSPGKIAEQPCTYCLFCGKNLKENTWKAPVDGVGNP